MNKFLNSYYKELFHYGVKSASIRYVDLDENELCHWKYIKREKLSNGKYRYYYSETDLKVAENEVNLARAKSSKESRDVINAHNDARLAQEKYENTEHDKRTLDGIKDALADKADVKKKQRQLAKEEKEYEQAAAKAEEAVKKYNTLKVVSAPRRLIAKATVAVANALSGVGKNNKSSSKVNDGKVKAKTRD